MGKARKREQIVASQPVADQDLADADTLWKVANTFTQLIDAAANQVDVPRLTFLNCGGVLKG